MFTTTRQKSTVGLDIEAASIAAAEISVNGVAQVRGYGIEPLPPGVFREGEVLDHEALADALKDLFAKYSLPKRVRLGVANQRVVVRTMSLPDIEDPKQLEAAIRFQAQDEIPMPVDQAVLEWEVVASRTGENGERYVDVVVVAARRDMVMALLEAMRGAGLRPVGIDLSAFAMIRALAGVAPPASPDPTGYIDAPAAPEPSTAVDPAAAAAADQGAAHASAVDQVGAGQRQDYAPPRLYCNLGDITNLAVGQGTACRFTRVSTFGMEGIAQRLAERRNLELRHARQWLAHVGLGRPLEEIEGDPQIVAATAEALAEGTSTLAEELRRSLDYYAAQEAAQPVESIVFCGPGTVIPGMVDRLQHDLGYPALLGIPGELAALDPDVRGRLTVSYGLALEESR